MNVLMDLLSEVELAQLSETRRISVKHYEDDEIPEEPVRRFGHKSWE